MCLLQRRKTQEKWNDKNRMTAFAYYRLPYLHHATKLVQHEGEPEVLASVGDLNGKEGFVVAPFSPSSDCPVVLIHPDEVKHLAVRMERDASLVSEENIPCGQDMTESEEQALYAQSFERFHHELEQGTFKKIVLARCSTRHMARHEQTHVQDMSFYEGIFMKTCLMYPRLFVALVYTEPSGMWLMATPEILLRGEECELMTISLAGTQKAEPSRTVADYPVEGVEWSEKNKEEQQYVTDYIEQCVKTFTDDYTMAGPYTTMAANLYHLRTDISFRLHHNRCLGDVIKVLYPTPAVCGIPKDEARQFILEHEGQSRKYYSGFVGPLSPEGKTNLFVSLRCMNILEDGSCKLYAGGGLLKESEMEKEWAETEAKLQTIKQVLDV